MSLQIGGLTPMTTIDYPGELAAVVFCRGCPWRCSYCHNQHLLSTKPDPDDLDWKSVLDFLQGRRGLLDAVVFSGGEPTAQHALFDAIHQIRDMGFKIGLHTAGPYPSRLARLLPLVDWVGLDIKALPSDYPVLTGIPGSGEKAWLSLNHVLTSQVPYQVRVTVDPELLPPATLRKLLGRLSTVGADEVSLQEYRKPDVGIKSTATHLQ